MLGNNLPLISSLRVLQSNNLAQLDVNYFNNLPSNDYIIKLGDRLKI